MHSIYSSAPLAAKQPDTLDTTHTTAMFLKGLGFSFFPIERGEKRPAPIPGSVPGANGERPRMPWAAYQKRQPTQAEIDGWFLGTDHGIAIVLGFGGIVAVDVDSAADLAAYRDRKSVV